MYKLAKYVGCSVYHFSSTYNATLSWSTLRCELQKKLGFYSNFIRVENAALIRRRLWCLISWNITVKLLVRRMAQYFLLVVQWNPALREPCKLGPCMSKETLTDLDVDKCLLITDNLVTKCFPCCCFCCCRNWDRANEYKESRNTVLLWHDKENEFSGILIMFDFTIWTTLSFYWKLTTLDSTKRHRFR